MVTFSEETKTAFDEGRPVTGPARPVNKAVSL